MEAQIETLVEQEIRLRKANAFALCTASCSTITLFIDTGCPVYSDTLLTLP